MRQDQENIIEKLELITVHMEHIEKKATLLGLYTKKQQEEASTHNRTEAQSL